MRFLLLGYILKILYNKAYISSINTPLNKRVGLEYSNISNGTVISAKESINNGYNRYSPKKSPLI